MAKVTQTSSRKADHIRINLEQNVASYLTTGLEQFQFPHEAIPELNLADIKHHITFFEKELSAPLLISSMTGGSDKAKEINYRLAEAAQENNIAMGLGSQRAALENEQLIDGFQLRRIAPNILLFANLGAVQLNYGYSSEECQRAIDMAEADALYLHLNAVQEAVQPEGDTNFFGLLKKIEEVCKKITVPVLVKEVGWGISGKSAKRLMEAGVAGIDVAGAGGTSWSQVEMHRAKSDSQARVAAAFADWGLPTSDSIIQIKAAMPNYPIIASGGLRNGVDIAKCIALGAQIGGIAGPYLKSANHSTEKIVESIDEVVRELQIAMFATGAANLEQLRKVKLISNYKVPS